MASFTLRRVDLFPAGTVVEARKRTLFGNYDPVQGTAPPGVAETTATSDGVTIPFVGLTDSAEYVFSGQVGGVWKHTNARTTAASASTTATLLSGLETPTGLYHPKFTDATALANVSGAFGIHSSGEGLIAAVAGVQAAGDLNLPVVLDTTKPWRVGALVEVNNPTDAQNVEVYLAAASSDANVALRTVGLNIPGDGYANLSMQVASAGGFHAIPVVAGKRYWLVISSDGGARVALAVLPDGHAGLSYTNGAAPSLTGQFENIKELATSAVSTGAAVTVFGAMSRLILKSKSTANRILGVFVNQGGYAGPADQRIKPPSYVSPVIGTDTTALVRFPGTYDGKSPIDIVYAEHANNSDEKSGQRFGDMDTGAGIAALVAAGYVVVSQRNGVDGSTYNTAVSSPWGAPAGLAGRKALIEWCRANIKNARNVYWLGQSMGLLNGLSIARLYPGLLKAIAGISGVTNLSYAYASEAFNTVINTAYGTASAAAVADFDPNLQPALFANVPLKLWHGDADVTVHKANHADLFKTRVEAQGGSVPVVNVAGATHLGAAGLWDATGLIGFFRTFV